MSTQEVRVLSKVVEVSRRELSDRDNDDVPAKMRSIAKSTARVLPAPFARSVLSELRRNESFRASVLTRWTAEQLDDPVGLAFLTDPDSSVEAVAKAELVLDVAALEERAASLVSTVADLDVQLAEAKKRLVVERESHATQTNEIASLESQKKRSATKSRNKLTAALRAAEDQIAARNREIGDLRRELVDSEARLRRRSERGRRKPTADPETRTDQRPVPPTDPVAFAAWLDSVERTQRPYRDAERAPASIDAREPLAIPDGVAPDERWALTALIDQNPRRIVIDGYNIAGLISNGPLASAANRSSVIAKAERLASLSGARVTVVFDAQGAETREGDVRETYVSPGGAEIRFSLTASADDQIVDIIRGDAERSVVITNDRELRERCVIDGCVSVWSSAFVDWSIH
ncbi:MAG: NYN domain-containing protein [Actinomycetia bacterium]|nr:NYN domain-containing protein [Actinomycetes bacterium]